MKVNIAADNYLKGMAETCVHHTVDRCTRMLKAFMRSLPPGCELREIINEHVAEHLRSLHRRGLKGSSISVHLMTIKSFLTWCENYHLIRKSPIDKFRLPKIVVIPSTRHCILAEHHERIMILVNNRALQKGINLLGFWRIVFEMAYRTGLRQGDIMTMRWTSVDFDRRVLVVTPSKTRRLNKRVVIPMDDTLYALLLEHKAKPYNNYGEHVCVLPEAEWYYHDNIVRVKYQFDSIMRRLGYEQFTFHSYRHGFVSRLVNSGVSPIVISSITGHCLEEIQTYAHVSVDAQRNALTQAGMPSALQLPPPTTPANVIPMIQPETESKPQENT